MADQDEEIEKPFAVERAKTGRAKCKKCKCPIEKDAVRIAKLMSNPFGDGKMKAWHHLTCIFDVFAKQRATTKRIEDPLEDVSGWDDLLDEDKKRVLEKLEEFEDNMPQKDATKKKTPKKKPGTQNPGAGPPAKVSKLSTDDSVASSSKQGPEIRPKNAIKKEVKDEDKKLALKSTRDDSFREFRRVCAEIANASAYTEKTAIVKRLLTKGSEGDGFKSDIVLWCKLLLPRAEKRIYNLQSKQLIKVFARLFRQSEDDMLEDLEQGDVAETIRLFFEKSKAVKSSSKSILTIQEVDTFLDELSHLTKEDEQIDHFRSITDKCTSNDLKMIVRLIKHDLRINAGPKHILEAVHPDAYRAYQVSKDLAAVIKRCSDGVTSPDSSPAGPSKLTDVNKVSLSLMTPVLPMLAEACKSVEMAMKKCPNGMLSEVKYDGERVQVHKKGTEFRYFSRSLKPVLGHKVRHFKDFIPKAFPDGDDLILDSEILMIDTTTGQPLPFGSLGKHKKEEFKDANVCLFVFDCIYYNGEVLLNKTMEARRKILENSMTIIPNRIMLSEVQKVHDPKHLAVMIAKILKMGLEGLVLKDMNSLYEPGKRHWLKVKKDYLFDGAMADSADLVVLGAWYGTGQKGGMMSVFLMGCYDDETDKWVTVTKVHTGHDDATLATLQDELDMVKIAKDHQMVPRWLTVNRPMVPDFVARDPKKQPVWEITGAEFTNQGVHTADGISIRFPRVTKIRDDKCWKTATSLKELRSLFEKSSTSMDFSLLLGTKGADDKKPTTLDTYLKPSTSGVGKSPTGSPSKVKKEVSSEDEEDEKAKEESKVNKIPSIKHKVKQARKSPTGSPLKVKMEVSSEDEEEEKAKVESKVKKSPSTKHKVKEVRESPTGSASKVKMEVSSEDEEEEKAKVESKVKKSPSTKQKVKEVRESLTVSPSKKVKRKIPSEDEEEESAKEEGKVNKSPRTKRKVKQVQKWNDDESSGSEDSDKYNGNAKALSRQTESKAQSNGIFAGVRAILSVDLDHSKRRDLLKILKTLGAKILKDQERTEATHVIHKTCEVPADVLSDYVDVPRTARHVNYSWVERSAAESRMLDALPYAVKLVGSYCKCPCPHRRRGVQ